MLLPSSQRSCTNPKTKAVLRSCSHRRSHDSLVCSVQQAQLQVCTTKSIPMMIIFKAILILTASKDTLVAFSGCSSHRRALLTGDYLVQKGETFTPDFVVVESGSLQFRDGSVTVKTTTRGGCFGSIGYFKLRKGLKKKWRLYPSGQCHRVSWRACRIPKILRDLEGRILLTLKC